MEFILADQDRMELGILSAAASLDIDLSRDAENAEGTNDGQMTVTADEGIEYGMYIFSPGSEFGGRILDLKRSTASESLVWYFDTWRRMLGQIIIEPPEGQAYKTVNGDAHTVLAKLLTGISGGLFTVPEKLSGITVSGQFNRYTTLLDGMNKLLESSSARLQIRAVQGGTVDTFKVEVSAVPIADYSAEIEYSQDNKIDLTIRDYRRGINHLICLGIGELAERMVRHLYVQADGSIGTVQYYTGLDERTAVYDYPNAEDENELLESGKEQLQEIASYQKLELSVSDELDLAIGDIIAGRDRLTGLYLKKPIVNKVLKIKKGKETISYKVEGDN